MKAKYLVTAVVIGLAVLLASYANAQTPSFQWAKRVASTTNADEELAIGLAMDNAANVYVTGWFDGTNDFGGILLTNKSGGGQDIFLAKYNASGALQWARRAGSDWPPGTGTHDEGRDAGRGIGVDGAGNVYVTGGFFGNADFGDFTVTAPTNREFFLTKYDSSGAAQWVRQSVGGNGMSNPGWDDGVYGAGLAVDDTGNCYAVGFAANVTAFGMPLRFGTITLLNTNTDGGSAFLVKYDNAGAVQWATSLNSPGESYSTAIALDGSGNVYVAGTFWTFMSFGTTNFVSSGGKDGFVAKFNSSGVLQWARQMSGASDAGAMGVSADAFGNVYVTGGFGNAAGATLTFAPSVTLTNVGGGAPGLGIGDAFLARYDASSGAVRWAQRFGGTGADALAGLTTDSHGNAYASGGAGGTNFPNGFDGFNAVVTKYDSDGVLHWTQSSGGASGAFAFTSPRVDSAGNCYVAGWYQGTVTFGATILQPQGYWNYFLAKVGFAPLTLGITWSNSMPWLSVSGELGGRFALEYTPTLPASNDWQSVVTNTLSSRPLKFPDTTATGNSIRFYRVRLVP